MNEQASQKWQYDTESEELRSESGSCIGRIEPESGPLAAAAPVLLAACKALLLEIGCEEYDFDVVDAARAAIRKAEGGTP
ncbi:MAG: hypothetical protein NTW96_24620 [Planctomycetia bacterium]|nr:hypothetical protein [Planctomycetia bacterium]